MRWTLDTHDGTGLALAAPHPDGFEVRAKIGLPSGEVKARGFGPTVRDAFDCCLRNLMEEVPK